MSLSLTTSNMSLSDKAEYKWLMLGSSVVLTVALFSIGLVLYFFYVATIIEEQVVELNTNRLVDIMVSPIIKIAPDSLNTYVQKLKSDPNPESDKQIEDNNNKLKQKSIKIIFPIAIFAILFTVLILLYFIGYGHLTMVLLDVFIMTCIVFMVEILFLYYFGRSYITLDENHIMTFVADDLLLNF
jgi:hypothetical protein